MADQEPLETTSQDADQLPERIRVHALAKRLGVTSKRILAKLTELGSDARSAQSNVDRAVAESVRDALAEPETDTPAPDTKPEAAPVEAAPSAQPASLFSAPESQHGEHHPGSGSTEPAHQPSVQLFTHPVREEPHVAEPVVFEAGGAVAMPLFLPPDASAVEQVRKQRRSRRSEEKERRVEEPPAEVDEVEDISAEDESDSTDESGDGDQPRRRRRGRRGRGRGRGEQHGENEGDDNDSDDENTAAESADNTDAADNSDADNDGDDDESNSDGSTRRRRRRRRRKVGGEGDENPAAEDDPPNTVVHEREPRNKSRTRAGNVDEVQGISGSTRLEAKRQRRRDGREAGRRRPPILTESEFLARREAVDRVMVVREKDFAGVGSSEHPITTQVAVLEDDILVEHFVTNTGSASMVGNIYLGRVQNVLPSMEAAFIDIGRGRNGVLYAGEVNWDLAGLGGKERKIEQALKPGDQVLVQVSKDPVGHKGARLTTQISLAGRFLVYVPGGTSTGISRKLPDTERKRLKEILRDIVPADAGVIIRTASEGVAEDELARDVERLQATWRTIEKAATDKSGGTKTLYEEPDLLVKVVRDLFNEDFSRLVIEGERSWTTVENYVRTVAPDMLDRVQRHDNNGVDVFEAFRIDEQLAKALDRKVWLPSGGTLVIDRTEAMTVVDVNTGKFTGAGGSNLEETVTRNNLEAAEEIVRQMRLRDIGGMIVVDFIDMVLESNRDLVLRRLTEALGRDRTRHQVSEVTSLGLVQMTRKKLGTGLVEAFSTTCEHCHGRGLVVHNYPVEPSSSSSEDSAGRKEAGGRRRRGRDKTAPAAPAAASTAPVEEEVESTEQIAVRRAHPVALAMAAHHDEHDEAQSDETVPATGEDAAADQPAVAVPEEDAADEVVRVGRGRRRARSERAAQPAAEPTLAEEIAADEPGPVDEAPEPVAKVTVAEPVAAAIAEPEPAAEPEQPAAERAVANGVPEAPATRPARRRRVARSAAAPAADSAGAVFVLSSAEEPAAPVVDFAAEPVPEELLQRKPRRRAVGRPAGPPVED
ncbi:translation initiation factor IF-2 N-terminal domain-containing protein [Nocardia sp. XZ_19_385]|uniref:translation initiation factor IF-2 N-terminal domain-containing protein n=1 Tax=Nocardia sp. XZ_19_385 TaxID=2769488 RepID=UPI0018903D44|nr:translation initiation factor IF-2 N-terminal domain-containing protein [Nocardia sp. XZ_19_385]